MLAIPPLEKSEPSTDVEAAILETTEGWTICSNIQTAFERGISHITLQQSTSLAVDESDPAVPASGSTSLKNSPFEGPLHFHFISALHQPERESAFEYLSSDGNWIDLRIVSARCISGLRGPCGSLAMQRTVKMSIFTPGKHSDTYFSIKIPHIEALWKRYDLSRKNGEQLITAQLLDTMDAVFVSIKAEFALKGKLSYLCHGKRRLFKEPNTVVGSICEFELLGGVDPLIPLLRIHNGPMLSLQTWNVTVDAGAKLQEAGKALLLRAIRPVKGPLANVAAGMDSKILAATHTMHQIAPAVWAMQCISTEAMERYKKQLLKRCPRTDIDAALDTDHPSGQAVDGKMETLRSKRLRLTPAMDEGASSSLAPSENASWETMDRLKGLTYREEQELSNTIDKIDGDIDSFEQPRGTPIANDSNRPLVGSSGRQMQRSYLLAPQNESSSTVGDDSTGNILSGTDCDADTFGQMWFLKMQNDFASLGDTSKDDKGCVRRRDFAGRSDAGATINSH
ncbi:hypothetical protein BASA50_000751 [Batrachochytrium salamandrivorans]|uniref:Uncharacterized protein n=1 Tax=Batrachochytrium salamandrivorans TaxID=1357716 RepID=A0ABQ8ETF7_9FUNG|nr:hypothetical protein BASA50_000751 [Batrachochytrium salamandrivorans]KAH6601542.1 hypothetical protein BASA61_001921 [Batrachochytrium salamandrivorans]KAH9265543.1 hypothetical protein BASA84_001546 [Batrachochytrium salamandrivorans]